MKTEKSCNNCNHHFSNHQRCDAIPCFGGDKWQPLPEQESKSVEGSNDKPCNKCTYNGHESICDQCNDFNNYEHFIYNDPYSKESMTFFKVFIKIRKELCATSTTNTYSFEEAIRKTFDEYAQSHQVEMPSVVKEMYKAINYVLNYDNRKHIKKDDYEVRFLYPANNLSYQKLIKASRAYRKWMRNKIK